jgi:23S rRNA pseudouridine2605 synthase
MLERIQKIIAAAGVTSRRAAEQLILDGRVRVNGQVVSELGAKADSSKDHIKVDGKLINPHQPMTYLMLNKPAGFVTTMADPEGRPTVLNLLKGLKVRVYPVGRLDYNTEGLLLLTNDGDFAHLITHPKHEFPKTYRAKVKGVLEDHQISQLESGIHLDDGKTAPAKIKKISKEEANSWLEITIHEGKKRQVRRMFDRVGHSVIKLKRIRTGNLVLGDLPEGAFRYLTHEEVQALKELAVKERREAVRSQAPGVIRQKSQVAAGKRPVAAADVRRREPVGQTRGEGGARPGEGRERASGSAGRVDWRKPAPGAPTGMRRREPVGQTRGEGKSRPGEGRARVTGGAGKAEWRKPGPGAQTDARRREPAGQTRGDARPRPGDDRARATVSTAREGWRRPGPGDRVPGKGASGRGARRPPRDEGSKQNQRPGFSAPGARKNPDFREKFPTRTVAARPGQELRGRDATGSSAFKPKGKKTIAARIRGKVFADISSSKPGTRGTAGPGIGDRKTPRSYDRQAPGRSTSQAPGRKPFRPKS